jgi:hypothetical protein
MLDNRKRIYALDGFTVEKRPNGWFYRRTYHDEDWSGPYSSEMSLCLMIAHALKRELLNRDRLPN